MRRGRRSGSATVVRSSARWSIDEAERILDEWATSGQTLHAFAQGRGLVPQRLRWWQKRLGGKRRSVADGAALAPVPAFLPVAVRPEEAQPVLAAVETADGLRVELRTLDGASAVWIASLVKALGAGS